MEGLERRVRETMEQYHMLDPGDRVVAAVSGGADSVCLLALLCTFREPWGIRLRALHVHHGLRGEEADRDADFVRSLCEGFHVPCHILKVDEMCIRDRINPWLTPGTSLPSTGLPAIRNI